MATTLLDRLATIALAVQADANDANLKFANDANILSWVNRCIADVAARGYWRTTGTLSLVANTAAYYLPTYFPTFLSLSKNDQGIKRSDTGYPLTRLATRRDYDIVVYQYSNSTGTPYHWLCETNTLYPAPVPDAALDLIVPYTEKPADRTSEDVKETALHWVQDSGATGHFVDETSPTPVAQTLGPGNDCPDIVEGVTVVLATGTFTITDITDDGEGTGEVTLSGISANAEVVSIYDADATNPPWPEPFDLTMSVPYCLWRQFLSDSTHTGSAQLATFYAAEYRSALREMLGAEAGPSYARPYR